MFLFFLEFFSPEWEGKTVLQALQSGMERENEMFLTFLFFFLVSFLYFWFDTGIKNEMLINVSFFYCRFFELFSPEWKAKTILYAFSLILKSETVLFAFRLVYEIGNNFPSVRVLGIRKQNVNVSFFSSCKFLDFISDSALKTEMKI
ncbi:hypothetical protein C1645_735588 [Glomus cerebriforme]|uniref:Uncharacterized protein n=1 Tax=Glomus cerebriforme TaxID=658196 RepID=A0A397T6B5_9GLOM|nr:hypothetical protein C1645_735588 [Glomus cerebriforme]